MREGRAAALLALLFLAALPAVDPRGEFPLNDDWSYTRSAFGLASDGRLSIDEWAAPSLIGQALYGGALARLVGPSFVALRLSTVALGYGLAVALWLLLRRLGAPPGFCWIAVAAWSFGPILFSLTFTFMTEVPFLFCMTLGLLLLERHLATGRPAPLAACGLALGFGFLIRQTAALFAAAALAALLARPGELGARARLRRGACLAAAFAPFVLGFSAWLAARGGPTPAMQRKIELLGRLGFEQLAGNTLGLLLYVGFLALPLVVYLIPDAVLLWRASRPRRRAAALAAGTALAGAGLVWFHTRYGAGPYLPSAAFHPRMPYLLNVLYDTGLGPVSLDPTYYRTPATPTYPVLWAVVTLATGAALVLLVVLAALAPARRWANTRDGSTRGGMLVAALLAFVLNAAFEIVFSHLEEGGLFDRHILSGLLPVIVTLGILSGSVERPRSRAAAAAAGLLAAAGALFGVAGTHDYLAWNRARWELGRGLLERGVDPLVVAGGFEFNGWHNYDAFRARGGVGRVYTWWYDDRRFLITLEPEAGYREADRRDYGSWVHRRRLPVYLLERIPRE